VFPGSEGRNGYENALRSNGGDENDKGSDDTEEDALHLRVVGDDLRLPVLDDRNFHVVTAYSLDLRRCRRYHLLDQKRVVYQSIHKPHCIAESRTFPIWYATPGKVARNPGGLISASCMGITPQAPCTPNCTQNAPAASVLKPDGMIHSGMKTPLSITNKIIVSRRPICCEIEPAMAPPLWKKRK
jgi:hypothetical protein